MTKPILPLISIITVTYNAEKYLEKTIQSIIQQTYLNIEYLVIDGKSADGTLAVIEKYKHHISQWISEKDSGIYDAMNKGLALAKGEYVWFMNAGDEIYEATTLEKIFANEAVADVLYGETEFRDLNNTFLGLRSEATPLKLPEKLHWRDLQMGLMVCHQAIIVRRSIAPNYDLNHPYSADIDWVIRTLKQSKRTIHTQQIVAIYLQGGFSRKNLRASLLDRFKIMQKHYGFWLTAWNHIRITFRGLFFILKNRKGY